MFCEIILVECHSKQITRPLDGLFCCIPCIRSRIEGSLGGEHGLPLDSYYTCRHGAQPG